MSALLLYNPADHPLVLIEQGERRQRPVRADDGGLWIMSPSQHERVDPEGGCDQAWALRYIEGIKLHKKSSDFGNEVHDVLEHYFNTLTLPSTVTHSGDVALRFLKRLPLPHASLLIEHQFSTTLAMHATKNEPIREQGKIDVYDPMRVCGFLVGEHAENNAPVSWPAFGPNGVPRPLIIDHKTTGSFQWLKTEAVLRGVFDPSTGQCLSRPDPQVAIYGWHALEASLRVYGVIPDEVHYRWNFALSGETKRQIKTVDLRMKPFEILRNVAVLLPETYHAIDLADSTYDILDFPKNVKACPKFGGCGYGPGTTKNPGLNICRLTSGERMRSLMSGNPSPSSLAQQAASVFGAGQQQQANPFAGGQQNQQQQTNPFANQQTQQAPASSPFGQAGGEPAQNPFAQQQAPQNQQQANPFAQQQAPQNQQQANPFANQQAQGQPMAQVMNQNGADVVNPNQAMFANQNQQQANPFANQAPQNQQQVQPTFAANQPAPQNQQQAPIVDPRFARIPPNIIQQGQTEQYLAWCIQNKLDLSTGQPLPNPVPPGTILPTGALAVPAQNGGVLFQGFNESGQNVQGTSWETLRGPGQTGEQTKTKKKRRTKAEMAAAKAAGDNTVDDDDESPQIIITEQAIDELIKFLQSLKQSGPRA